MAYRVNLKSKMFGQVQIDCQDDLLLDESNWIDMDKWLCIEVTPYEDYDSDTNPKEAKWMANIHPMIFNPSTQQYEFGTNAKVVEQFDVDEVEVEMLD